MSAGIAWLSTFLLLPLAGLPLLSHPAFRRFSLLARAVLSGGAGAVLVSFSMTAFALCGVAWSILALLAASAVLSWILRRTIRDAPAPRSSGEGLRTVPALAGILAAAAVLAALLATQGGAASSPDLLFFWGAKAQQYAAARTIDTRFLADPFLQYMHPYYPPLVTNLYALASMAAGRMCWTAATLVFPLLLAALALGLPGALRAGSSTAAAASTSALIVSAIAYFGMEADIGGNGEMPLLFFETTAMALLISRARSGAGEQLVAGLLLCGAACAKVEALPFVLAAAALYLWIRREEARPIWAAALRLLGPTALSLGAWFTFGATRHLFRGYSDGGGRFLDLHPEHARLVVRATAAALESTGYGLPYLIPLLCLLVSARRLTRLSVIPLGAAGALIGFLFFTYLHRAEDPTQWIVWSAARVLSPVAVMFALAAPVASGWRLGPEARAPEA